MCSAAHVHAIFHVQYTTVNPRLVAGTVVNKDITTYCKDLVALLTHARSLDQRVTPLKLLDAWLGKGDVTLRLGTVRPPKLSRHQCERVVIHLLMSEYLKEDFHFTPYSTISYLVPGTLV